MCIDTNGMNTCNSLEAQAFTHCFCLAGVVYRVRDTSVVVAVDDVPEEGLDQPLRLEKLANEVKPGK